MCYTPRKMNFTYLIVIAAAAILLFWAFAPKGQRGTPSAVKQKISSGAKVVDVRSRMEYEQGHWEGAIHIPLGDVSKRLAEFGPTNQPIVVYCHSGNRSARAQTILQQAGYTDVTNAGGLSDLRKAMQ